MRRTRYPHRGKPNAVNSRLDELVMLLQASIELANTERWALERGLTAAPATLAGLLRGAAYEVTVVDRFNRIARQYFERVGARAVWERPFATGVKGRPYTVDLSLFDGGSTETRIELGPYSKVKLKDDMDKLHLLRTSTIGTYSTVINQLALWQVKNSRLTAKSLSKWMDKMKADATSVSAGATATPPATPTASPTVSPLLASAVDLFVADTSAHRHVIVGIFQVT